MMTAGRVQLTTLVVAANRPNAANDGQPWDCYPYVSLVCAVTGPCAVRYLHVRRATTGVHAGAATAVKINAKTCQGS